MNLIQPVLAFNVANANSELKRLNELLFRELLTSYGEKLYSLFDEKCAELIRSLVGQSGLQIHQLETPQLLQAPVSVTEHAG